MKKLYQKILIVLLGILVVGFYAQKINNTTTKYNAEYVYTIDGDTSVFKVNDEEIKVRYLAINTPEVDEDYYEEAKDFVDDKLSSATKIVLEKDPNADQDKYGRYLFWVFVDGELLNGEIVSKGLAEVTYLYDDYLYTDELLSLQKEAKANKLGLWS